MELRRYYFLALIGLLISVSHALVLDENQYSRRHSHHEQLNRRDVLTTAVSLTPLIILPTTTQAIATEEAPIDMAAINAARNNGPSSSLADIVKTKLQDNNDKMIDMDKLNAIRSNNAQNMALTKNGIVPLFDPSPLLSIRNCGMDGKSRIKIPRVGYSFYKTPSDQASRCTALALRAGVCHFDVATDYGGSNAEIGRALKLYLNVGMTALNFADEKPELLERLDATAKDGKEHAAQTSSSSSSTLSPPPQGSAGRRGRREGLFLHHKLSNSEQSTDPVVVRRAVKGAIATLGCSYLDMASIHSSLTDKARRLESYKALLDLRDSGFIKSVGVCNYGVAALQEILYANLDLPAVNQLELSPFNQHKDVVDWCNKQGVAISCSAWSRLSSADGPTEQWDILSKLAQEKKMTKAQVMVRWALQKGYICVPRSSSASKVERVAIAENSYGGVNSSPLFMLTPKEMQTLNGLDVSFPAGKLGRRDGWSDADVTGPDWDPTKFV